MQNSTSNNNSGKKKIYTILFAIFLIIFLGAAGAMLFQNYQDKKTEDEFDKLSNMTIDTQTEETEQDITESETETVTESETEEVDELAGIDVPEKNLDWDALKSKNEHIYAWIYIPNTNVDYPILQHPKKATYYLRRGLDGKNSTAGCIFTEKYNSMDFTDPNTVIYGHNMRNKTMFATLHNYESLDFFKKNPYVYIYMPDKVLVYEIFAAYERGDEHLLFTYNFNVKENFQAYLDSVFAIRDMNARIKKDVEVTADDTIISLSTCVYGENTERYLVQGVLVNPSALEVQEVETE